MKQPAVAAGSVRSGSAGVSCSLVVSIAGRLSHIRLHGSSNGAGAGDDEVIQLQLSRVNPQVQKIAFVITINEALQRGHNFGGVQNAYVRVTDKSTGKEMIRFNLTDCYKEVTSMTVGELYRKDGTWRFNAVGQGLNTDLAGLCGFYGVNIGG